MAISYNFNWLLSLVPFRHFAISCSKHAPALAIGNFFALISSHKHCIAKVK